MGQDVAVIILFTGMAARHLIGAVLAHAQAVAPAETVNRHGLAGFDLEIGLAGDSSGIGIRRRTTAAVKIEERTAQAKDGLEGRTLDGDAALRPLDDHGLDPAGNAAVGRRHGPLGQGRQLDGLDAADALAGSTQFGRHLFRRRRHSPAIARHLIAGIADTAQIRDMGAPDIFTVFRPAAGSGAEKGVDRPALISDYLPFCRVDGFDDRRRFAIDAGIDLARRIVGKVEAALAEAALMGNGIGPGGDGLGLQGLFAPRRRHFLADDAVEILFHRQDVDDGQAPAAGRFHHFQGAAVGVAVSDLDGAAVDQGPDLDRYGTDVAVNGQVRPRQSNGDGHVGRRFLPEHVAAIDTQALRPGDGHTAPAFADADAQGSAIVDGLFMCISRRRLGRLPHRFDGLAGMAFGLGLGRRRKDTRRHQGTEGRAEGQAGYLLFIHKNPPHRRKKRLRTIVRTALMRMQVTMGKWKDVLPLVKEISPGRWPRKFPSPRESPAIHKRPATMKKRPVRMSNFAIIVPPILLMAQAGPDGGRRRR